MSSISPEDFYLSFVSVQQFSSDWGKWSLGPAKFFGFIEQEGFDFYLHF